MKKFDHQFKTFIQTFLIIFLDKISDKSKLIEFYLTSNFDTAFVLRSYLISNIFLILIAVICAQIISFRMSNKYLRLHSTQTSLKRSRFTHLIILRWSTLAHPKSEGGKDRAPWASSGRIFRSRWWHIGPCNPGRRPLFVEDIVLQRSNCGVRTKKRIAAKEPHTHLHHASQVMWYVVCIIYYCRCVCSLFYVVYCIVYVHANIRWVSRHFLCVLLAFHAFGYVYAIVY